MSARATAKATASAEAPKTAKTAKPPPAKPKPPSPAFAWRHDTSADGHLGHGKQAPDDAAWGKASAATLWGAEAAKCKARQLPGWLRLDCALAGEKADKPTIEASGNGAWRARWDDASITLVAPIGAGLTTGVGAKRGKNTLSVRVQWRIHAPAPKVLGYINDAELPRCAGKLLAAGAAYEGDIEDCARAGYTECGAIAACLRGEPSNFRDCPKGWRSMRLWCAYPCTTPSDCGAPGWSCDKSPDSTTTCHLKSTVW